MAETLFGFSVFYGIDKGGIVQTIPMSNKQSPVGIISTVVLEPYVNVFISA